MSNLMAFGASDGIQVSVRASTSSRGQHFLGKGKYRDSAVSYANIAEIFTAV